MSSWNYDLSQAPKGSYKQVTRMLKDREYIQEVHVPELIIAAGNGGVVNVSRWLPEEERWSMYSKSIPPLAWMPWPKHPEET